MACFQDCPVGFFESRQCIPPNVVQQCTACRLCPTGYYIQTPCSRNNDTECARCTSSICVSDEYNAQFSTSGGCQGTELQDSAMCGTIKESYGQRCPPNSYRVRNRINMPHAWGASALTPAAGPSHRALNDSRFNASMLRQPLLMASVNSSIPAELQPYLAFDVHPTRKVYAYCSGNTILTYDYQGLQTGVFLDFAHVPEPCSDIRFTASGKYLMVTSRSSTKLFRCDPQCATNEAFVLDVATNVFVCKSPLAGAVRSWGDGLNVSCTQWVAPSAGSSDYNVQQEGRVVNGGVHIFGSLPESVMYVAGTFKSISTVSSWVWFAWADASPIRGPVHNFAAGVQVVAPPAYNPSTRCLFVAVRDHNQSTKRYSIHKIVLKADGTKDGSPTVFYEQLYSSVAQSLNLVTPFIPGFSIRTDTGDISMVDEQLQSILVFTCPTAANSPQCNDGPEFSTPYGSARYKDLEFVARFSTAQSTAASSPSKLFITSLQDPNNARAELYVQCAKCSGGGITSTESEAMSQEDCFCQPGYRIVTSPVRGCVKCRCDVK